MCLIKQNSQTNNPTFSNEFPLVSEFNSLQIECEFKILIIIIVRTQHRIKQSVLQNPGMFCFQTSKLKYLFKLLT